MRRTVHYEDVIERGELRQLPGGDAAVFEVFVAVQDGCDGPAERDGDGSVAEELGGDFLEILGDRERPLGHVDVECARLDLEIQDVRLALEVAEKEVYLLDGDEGELDVARGRPDMPQAGRPDGNVVLAALPSYGPGDEGDGDLPKDTPGLCDGRLDSGRLVVVHRKRQTSFAGKTGEPEVKGAKARRDGDFY